MSSVNNVALTGLGASATALNTYSTFVPNNGIDGNDTTQWIGLNYTAGQYLQVDLGQVRTIAKYRILWSSNIATSVDLQSSPDAVTWTTRASHAGVSTELDTGEIALAANQIFRYWRLLTNGPVIPGSPGNGNSPQIFTLELIADPTTLAPTARVTQIGVEAVELPTPNARVTQAGIEVVDLPTSVLARVTQVGVEVVDFPLNELARVTQFGFEVVYVTLPAIYLNDCYMAVDKTDCWYARPNATSVTGACAVTVTKTDCWYAKPDPGSIAGCAYAAPKTDCWYAVKSVTYD